MASTIPAAPRALQLVACGDPHEHRHDRAGRADRGDDRQRPAGGRRVEQREPARVARAGQQPRAHLVQRGRRAAVGQYDDRADRERDRLTGHQHGHRRQLARDLGPTSPGDAVTESGAQGQQDRRHGELLEAGRGVTVRGPTTVVSTRWLRWVHRWTGFRRSKTGEAFTLQNSAPAEGRAVGDLGDGARRRDGRLPGRRPLRAQGRRARPAAEEGGDRRERCG